MIRDQVGDNPVAVGMKTNSVWFGAEYEEARALLFGLEMAWASGYRRLLAEGDCATLFSKLNKHNIPNSPLGLIIKDIFNLAAKFDFCKFQFVRRDGNMLAHTVAKSSFVYVTERFWLEDFPDFVSSIAQRDILCYYDYE